MHIMVTTNQKLTYLKGGVYEYCTLGIQKLEVAEIGASILSDITKRPNYPFK